MTQNVDGQSSFAPQGAGTVMLPCEPDQFRDFIAGLLGQPQTITRRLTGPYEVNRDDVENLYQLIDQRLTSQNDATLIQFAARIVYEDNSSVLLNSLYDFQTYNEVKPLCSVGLHLSWTYLIKFRNKKFPEKQQIEVGFTTADGDEDFEAIVRARGITISAGYAGMRVRINHTDRTWGTDIDALLNGHLQLLQKPMTRTRSIAYEHSGKIGVFTSLFVFTCSLFGAYLITNHYVNRYLGIATGLKIDAANNFDTVARKIDFLIGIIASGMWTRYAVYLLALLLVSVIASIFSGLFITSRAEKERPSFVLLTKAAEEKRRDALARYETTWWIFVGSIVGSLFLSVLGNYLFYKLTQYWTL